MLATCAILTLSQSQRVRDQKARAIASSIAADEDKPEATGMSLASTPSQPFNGTPVSCKAQAMPFT